MMTTQQITFELPPFGAATLTLPEHLTPEAFARLDSALGQALRQRRQESSTDASNDPGTIEFDSWLVDQH